MAWCACRATVIGKCTITFIRENYFQMKLRQTTQIGGSAATDMIVKKLVSEHQSPFGDDGNACVCVVLLSIVFKVFLFCVTASGLVRLPLKLAVHHPLLANRVVTRSQQGFCCVRVVRLLQTLARVFMPDWAVLSTENTILVSATKSALWLLRWQYGDSTLHAFLISYAKNISAHFSVLTFLDEVRSYYYFQSTSQLFKTKWA